MSTLVHPADCLTHGDGYRHPPGADDETPCPKAPSDDPGHCIHWYDAERCCRCGDPGLEPCPACAAGVPLP